MMSRYYVPTIFIALVLQYSSLIHASGGSDSSDRWFNFDWSLDMGVPFFISTFTTIFSFTFFAFVISQFCALGAQLLPISLLAGAQQTILGALGVFYPAMHFLGIFARLPVLVWPISIGCAGFAFFLSLKDDGFNLCSSIGAGYVSAYALVYLSGYLNVLFFCMVASAAGVGYIIWGKLLKVSHYATVRSLICSFVIVVLADLVTPLRFKRSVHGDTWFSTYIHIILGILLFSISAVLIFIYTFSIGMLKRMFTRNKE